MAEAVRERAAPPRWRVEPARPGDEAALARISAASFRDRWSAAAFRDELAHPDARLWVVRARPAGDALGYLAARWILDEFAILSLAVAPAWRRRGLGAALLAAALAEARRGGAARAILEVRVSNRRARRFYRRHGFGVVGRRRRFYPDGEDALLMGLPLARSASAGRASGGGG